MISLTFHLLFWVCFIRFTGVFSTQIIQRLQHHFEMNRRHFLRQNIPKKVVFFYKHVDCMRNKKLVQVSRREMIIVASSMILYLVYYYIRVNRSTQIIWFKMSCDLFPSVVKVFHYKKKITNGNKFFH